MKVTTDKWVVIDYTLKGDDGNVIDTSVGKEPLGYLHGCGMLIPGLEKELEGKDAGEKLTVSVPPKEAYGEFDKDLILDVPKDRFDPTQELELGMMFQVDTPQGPIIVRVIEIGDKTVKIDGNHELAGKTLHFDVEIKEVRDATEEELNYKNGGCGGCGGGCGGNCGSDCGCDGNCDNGGCGCN